MGNKPRRQFWAFIVVRSTKGAKEVNPTRKQKKCPVKKGGCGWLMKHLGSGRYTCTNPECPVEMDNNGTITYKPVTPPLPFA